MCELKRNQVVVFPNGERHGYLEACWSNLYQAYVTFVDDDDDPRGYTELLSTTIEEKPIRKSNRKFVPNAKNCPVQIKPCGETEKAYIVCTGTNGCVTRSNIRYYYEYVAKSVCYLDENGNVYCPVWAKP